MDPNAAPAALRAPAPPPAWLPAPGHPGPPVSGHPAPPAPEPLVRRLLVPLGTLAAVAAAFTYVGAVDPNHPGHYPVCPLYAVTGIYCPGCGGLRSAHAVAHGDFAAALGDNALAVVGYAVFAVVMVVWLIRAVRGRPAERFTVRPALWWGIGAVVLVFSVLRNLPMGSFLAP
ncbi:DUF2752 domain-containing protein [Streptomyces sp. NBC_01306]|uniref:DUF2752 domain-containing protein n=1 Tax=Streptomyces sp. NBC_01306 TaxID=2903819 RepID=UPI00224F4C13|nr:DUF2752 domain-containing protein [Streptomyces sp. NBC_01306]MCX4727174.1 DUF2752 domain-containing protein [Streptomyces sp. NBC_01306]